VIWLSWRLHRSAVFAFAAIFGLMGALYLVDSFRLQHAFDVANLRECIGVLNNASCHTRVALFIEYEAGWRIVTALLVIAAAGALGVFLGGPLVGTEFERGTWQWIWTQPISRTRWLAVNYLVVGAMVAVLGAMLGAAFSWWARPLTALQGSFDVLMFDNTPLMCAVYSLFGFSVGVAASALLRRTLAAMGATIVVFLATRFAFDFLLRRHYMSPVLVEWTADEYGRPLTVDRRDWGFIGSWADSAGKDVDDVTISRMLDPQTNPAAAGQEWYEVLRQNGIHYYDWTQPYQRFGTFQLIEACIFLGLTVVCAALAFWRIRRRTA